MDIKPTSERERNLSQMDFFLLWAGAAISIMEMLSGALLAPLGLFTGVVVILVGHAIGNTPFALACLPGQEKGVTSMVSLRFSFGTSGSKIFTLFNIMQLIGWMAVMQIVAAEAMNAITLDLFSYANRELWIVLIGVLTTLWAMSHRAWKILNKISIAFLIVLTLVITWRVFSSFQGFNPPTEVLPMGIALDIVIAMPISWLPLVSDYSRFAKKGSMKGTWIGYFLISSWMYFIGLISALATGESFPTTSMLLLGLGLPAMIVILLSTVTSDYLDVYSSAASWMNIRKTKREKLVMGVVGALGIVVSLLFPIDQYQNFLLLIGSLFCPLFGVVIVDYLLRRNEYSVDDALRAKGGKYWFLGGFNPLAFASWGFGMAVYWIANLYFIGGSLPSILLASLLYLLLDRAVK